MKKTALLIILFAVIGISSFAQTITAYEYWFDDNFAGKTTVNVTAGTTFSLATNISTSALSQGPHTFFFHTRSSDGKWSVPVGSSFVNGKNNITGIEYWYDHDYSTKSTVAVTPGFGGTYTQPLNVSGLTIGNHTISICFVDGDNVRSAPVSSDFYYDGSVTGIPVVANDKIRVFPNPAVNEIQVTGIDGCKELAVTDISGKIVLQQRVSGNAAVLDVQTLLPGLYTIILSGKTGKLTREFIKCR